MNNKIYLRSTVTGKRQITIPKEICDMQNINTGDQVIFKELNGNIIFEKEQNTVECFACKGEGYIEKKSCFLCNGEGRIYKTFDEDYMQILKKLLMTGRKFGLCVQFNSTEEIDSEIKLKDFPTITLFSEQYSRDVLDYIQDQIQKRIIQAHAPRCISDENNFLRISDDIIRTLINNLQTEDAKNEILAWFGCDKKAF